MAVSNERLLELQQLYEQLKLTMIDIDEKYSIEYVAPKLDMPDSLNLQKLEYTPKTQEELQALAELAVEAVIIAKLRSVERTYSSKLKSLALNLEQLNLNYEKKVATRTEQYADERKEIRRKLILHGLVFSTTFNNYYQIAHEEFLADSEKINNQADAERELISKQQADAEQLYQESCASIEEERQARVNDKLQKLIDDEEDERVRIEKYNNSLEEKEQKYQASRAKAYETANRYAYNRAYKNAQLYLQAGETAYRQLIMQEKYIVCKNAFYPLRREEANLILQFDSALINNLGKYYSSLVDWINTTLLP